MRAYAGLVAFIFVLLVAGKVGASGPTPGPVGGDGTFFAQCRFSHRASDDPIVFRRAPGKSHSHDFVGGKTTAFSTGRKLRKGRTTCVRPNARGKRNKADKSGYWVPTLYENGRPVFPASPGLSTYYFTGTRDYTKIRPFPTELRIIAGSSEGRPTTSFPVAKVFSWTCGGGPELPPGGPQLLPGGPQLLPARPAGQAPTCAGYLNLEIRFPDCWNGIDRDSKDHRSHMAYSVQERPGNNKRVCPRSHPVLVPMLVIQIRYPTKGGPGIKLASGDLRTAHADFLNGWDQRELKRLVRGCLAKDLYCGGNEYPVPGHH